MSGIGVDWRVVVVGGHTRNIGKTQLVCDLIAALPEAEWIAGKITQYGHGVCAQNGADCDCAPDEQVALVEKIAQNEEHPSTPEERFFVAAKRATVDGYYTSAIGIHQDLEYQGNTAVAEFPGCTHAEHKG